MYFLWLGGEEDVGPPGEVEVVVLGGLDGQERSHLGEEDHKSYNKTVTALRHQPNIKFNLHINIYQIACLDALRRKHQKPKASNILYNIKPETGSCCYWLRVARRDKVNFN